jgi:hypothetical protein
MFADAGYTIARNVVPPLLCRFITEQFNLMIANGQMPYNDNQVEKAYYGYGFYVTETLLAMLLPTVARETAADLAPTYSYSRLYLNGAELTRHVDRPCCEVSATLTLATQAATPWPLCVQGRDGRTVEVDLKPGDMLIYSGMELPHWRVPFSGEWQLQAFLHYVRKDGPHAGLVFDSRPRLGAPKQAKDA